MELTSKQRNVIFGEERFTLFTTGIGYGKTFTLALWIIKRCLENKGVNTLVTARDYGQLRDATDKEIEKVLAMMGCIENSHYVKNRTHLEYIFTNGSRMVLRSSKNYDSAFRGASYQFIAIDEIEYIELAAFNTVIGRLRGGTPMGVKEQLMGVSSPRGFNDIYQFFCDHKDSIIYNAKSTESPRVTEEYIEALRVQYSPKTFAQEVLGERLNVNEQSVYEEFDRRVHVSPCAGMLESYDQIYAFLDYNVHRYPCIYMVKRGERLYCIGEEYLTFGGSREMATKIKARFPGRPIIVIGDSAGNHKKDVASDTTNYQIFEQAGLLPRYFHNPPVEARIINANSRLYHNKIIVDPSCEYLIKDLEQVNYTDDGNIDKKSNLDLTHSSDAWSYGVWHFLPLQQTRPPSNMDLI